jgi:hypothetical protein
MSGIIPLEKIENKIFLIRGLKVMIDRDLAELYGVDTKVLNQSVKRNIDRFPEDFMFRLKLVEYNELVTNCDRFASLKHSSAMSYAFTEQGVAMLSSVLKSSKAIKVNIAIMRVFVKIKEYAFTYKILDEKIKELEKKYDDHDDKIIEIFRTLNCLIRGDGEKKKKEEIGFKAV